MSNTIQINGTWKIDMDALTGLFIVGKPVSKRELFTKHGVMLKDGNPYTGDKRGNMGTNTMNNFLSWLKQCADYTVISNKILIDKIKPVSSVAHITKKPQYKPYFQTLFFNCMNGEFEKHFTNEPPDNITVNMDYSIVNDFLPVKFNVFGDLYNSTTASYYDSKLKEELFRSYDICHQRYFNYIMRCLRNSIIQNIDYAIESVAAAGLKHDCIYTIDGKPLTKAQKDYIYHYYSAPILANRTYQYDLTGEINRRIKEDFKDKGKAGALSNTLQINEFSPICQTWKISIDRAYKPVPLTIDTEFCRKKLNENAIQKVQDISG